MYSDAIALNHAAAGGWTCILMPLLSIMQQQEDGHVF
jgi:hypothetical protein